MNTSRFPAIAPNVDLGQLFLRLGGSFLLFHVHGLPKVVHNNKKLLRIEDPLHFGGQATVLAAIFARS